jgi:hypothetical protein
VAGRTHWKCRHWRLEESQRQGQRVDRVVFAFVGSNADPFCDYSKARDQTGAEEGRLYGGPDLFDLWDEKAKASSWVGSACCPFLPHAPVTLYSTGHREPLFPPVSRPLSVHIPNRNQPPHLRCLVDPIPPFEPRSPTIRRHGRARRFFRISQHGIMVFNRGEHPPSGERGGREAAASVGGEPSKRGGGREEGQGETRGGTETRKRG